MKENRRTKLTKMLIKDGLLELMQTQPIYKITIKDICDKADVNRSTFYVYYKDQYDLLASIENDIINEINENLQSYSSYDSDRDKNLQIIENLLSYLVDNVVIWKLLLSNDQNYDFLKKITEFTLQHLIGKMSVEKKWDKKTTRYIYLFAISGSIGLIQNWIDNGLDKSTKEISEMILKLTSHGIISYS